MEKLKPTEKLDGNEKEKNKKVKSKNVEKRKDEQK